MKCKYPQRKERTNKGVVYPYEHNCGQCLPCRIRKRAERSTRIYLESSFYPAASQFVTLTFDDENEPADKSVSLDVMQRYIKNLRQLLKREFDLDGIRYFAVGEYGDKSLRPHYHLALFGIPGDLPYVEKNPKYQKLYQEVKRRRKFQPVMFPNLEQLFLRVWEYQGYVSIEEMKNGMASYIAGYITKKMDPDALEIPEGRAPEFATMSNRPGIAGRYAPVIAEVLQKYRLYPFQHENMRGGSDWKPINWSAMVRIEGRPCPLDKYMRDKIISHMGGDERSEHRKAVIGYAKFMKIGGRDQVLAGSQGIIDYRISEAEKEENRIRRLKKFYKSKGNGRKI